MIIQRALTGVRNLLNSALRGTTTIGVAGANALQINAYNLLAGDNPDTAVPTSAPVSGQWYILDVGLGLANGKPAQAASTAFSCVGATVDSAFSANYNRGHTLPLLGPEFDLGFVGNNYPVYYTPGLNVLGFWRVLFPSTGTYVLAFANAGSVSVTVAGTAPALTVPTLAIKNPQPLGREPAKVFVAGFTGTYPAGGLDLLGSMVGIGTVFIGLFTDTNLYRFTWDGAKLKLFTSTNVEASGAVTFSTTVLFIGAA